jgi:tricarballylate dehydrogenase
VWYGSPAHDLIVEGRTVKGVRVQQEDRFVDVEGVVVLGAGGFEANPELRERYLGAGWDLVKVRGTRFNMGAMLMRAMDAGAQSAGHWGGAHASPQDYDCPPVGDLAMTDKMSRYSYPYALMVNIHGQRFIDEGEDELVKTYAKTGAAIREQPQGKAFQIFDAKTVHLLEPRYETGEPIVADSLEELEKVLGIPEGALLKTVRGFNAATHDGRFDPFVNDGLSASPEGQPVKSNWALPLDTAPYTVYPVTCGITFTYGGLKIDEDARVIDKAGNVMPGLYATGELTGGFFFHNYPAGAGLVRGAVFGRIAGGNAAALASKKS